jgi:hypothetical protein
MNRASAVFVLAAALLSPLAGQTSAEKSAAPAAACPSTATLDQLIHALDDAVSGPGDKDRACFRGLFLPDARLMPLVKSKDGGSVAPRVLTVQGWIDAVAKRGSAVFYERQVKVRTETWANEAHLWSTFEVRPTPDGKPDARGINSIQAVYDGQRWKVVSILWQDESPDQTLPEKYLH